MIRMVLLLLMMSTAALPGRAAFADELNDAIDAFLREDYSQVDAIARYAEDGEPKAVAILGQAYIYGNGVAVDEPLGVALLEQAASLGERSSAVQLGRVFEFGLKAIPPDPVQAAKWYVEAARNGDTTSAPAALKRLPPEIVIAAGGAAWAADFPEATGDASTVTAALQPAASTNPVDVLEEITLQTPVSPARALLGADEAPAPLSMLDKTSFPVFADTRLSAVGDAAASCFIVLKPEIEKRQVAMNNLMELGNTTTPTDSGVGYNKLLESERDLKAMNEALQASQRILSDPRENGGLTAEAVRLALMPHKDALETRPHTGPTATFCGKRLVQLIGESAGWAAQ